MTLQLAQLTVSHRRSHFTLGPITAEFSPGITGIVGVNGAGKSTLFNTIVGTLRPSSGRVMHRDTNIGYLPQNPIFPKNATVRDVLTFSAWLHKLKDPQERITDLITRLGLEEHATKRTSQLSGGMQRRLGIAQALVHDPAILLLDEPTAGLDPVQRIAVRTTIEEELGNKTVLLSTHLVEDIRHLASQLLVLDQGQVVFNGSVDELESTARDTHLGATPLEVALNQLYTGSGKVAP